MKGIFQSLKAQFVSLADVLLWTQSSVGHMDVFCPFVGSILFLNRALAEHSEDIV